MYSSTHSVSLGEEALISRIQHVEFLQLQRLNLGGNSLWSVEGLHRASMPNLRQLLLRKEAAIEGRID